MALLLVQMTILYFAGIQSLGLGQDSKSYSDEYLRSSVDCLKKMVTEEQILKTVVLIKSEYLKDFDFVSPLVKNGTFTTKIFTDSDRPLLVPGLAMWKRTASIIFVANANEARIYTQKLRKQKHLSARGYFFVIPITSLSEKSFEDIGIELRKFRVINSLIFKNSSEGIQLVTNFPYKNKKCDKYSPTNDEVLAICYWNGSINYVRKHNPVDYYPSFIESKLFPAKIPRNLDGCPLKIVTGLWPPNVIDVQKRDYPGIEIDFINMIGKHMNFVPQYIYVNDVVGQRTENGSWTGFMGYLERNEADLAIGSIHLDFSRQFIFDQSYWYLNNFILWVVPRASTNRKLEFLSYLIMESTLATKGAFVLAFYLVTLTTVIISRIRKNMEKKVYTKFGETHFVLIQIFLVQPLKQLPKSIKGRWTIGSWIFFCSIIAFFLQTSITSFLMAPFKPREINTMDEVFQSKLHISYERYYDYIVEDHKFGKELIKLNKGFPLFKNLQEVSKGTTFTIADKLRSDYMTQQWINLDGIIPVRKLKHESQHFDWTQIVMTKGHFLFKWINEMVTKAGNNGFWNFMVSQYVTNRRTISQIRQQIVFYNHMNGRDNTRAINKYNSGVFEAFPQNALNEAVNKIFYPTPVTAEELISTFNINKFEKTISFGDLSTVFSLLWGGFIISTVVFLLEIIVYFILKKLRERKEN